MRARLVRLTTGAVLLIAVLAGCSDDSNTVATDDGSGTTSVHFRFQGPGGDPLTQAIEARLAQFGIEDATLRVGSDDQGGTIEVVLPVHSDDGALEAIALSSLDQQGVLRFRPILSTTPGAGTTTPPEADDPSEQVDLPELEPEGGAVVAVHHLGPTALDGRVVEQAAAQVDEVGLWQVHVKITLEAIEGFNAVATECFAKTALCPLGQLAIVLDSEVLSAPTISQPSYERDQIVISGDYTEREATVLAAALDAGPLPSPLTRIPPPPDS